MISIVETYDIVEIRTSLLNLRVEHNCNRWSEMVFTFRTCTNETRICESCIRNFLSRTIIEECLVDDL